jgi:hypothetical protein
MADKKRIIKFKSHVHAIVIGAQKITQADIDHNPALYDWLINHAEGHKDHFTVTDESGNDLQTLPDAKEE